MAAVWEDDDLGHPHRRCRVVELELRYHPLFALIRRRFAHIPRRDDLHLEGVCQIAAGEGLRRAICRRLEDRRVRFAVTIGPPDLEAEIFASLAYDIGAFSRRLPLLEIAALRHKYPRAEKVRVSG